jgi:RND family efflux transporter MFP subunit
MSQVAQDAQSAVARSMAARRNRQKYQLVAVGVVLLLAVAAYFLFRPVLVAEVGVVERGEAISAVYGTIRVEPLKQVLIRTRIGGILKTVKVNKGDPVAVGDLLAEVVDDRLTADLTQATRDLKAAQRKREIGPGSLPDLNSKKDEVQQLTKLLEQKVIPQLEYDKAVNQIQLLERRVQQEQLVIDQTLDSAGQALENVQSEIGQGVITSSLAGAVLEVYARVGEAVKPQDQLFLVGGADNQLVALVNEEDVGLLKSDMKAVVRLYSYQGQDFQATLKDILPLGENQTYSVNFVLDNPPEKLLPGMTGELNVIVGKHKDTLILPSRAIRIGPRGPMVMCVEGGIVQERDVTVGFRSIEKTEVTGGVKEGDMVILSNHDLYKSGDKVKPEATQTPL